MIPAFVPVPSGGNYKLCTQGCWPAALLCSSPTVSPPNASWWIEIRVYLTSMGCAASNQGGKRLRQWHNLPLKIAFEVKLPEANQPFNREVPPNVLSGHII
ncbi:unnamed protein product [Penicillium camemberti]|uniref:Str. FM013 n=1 Tax=Penicillium camemberti (strain FM 013) TaxID=1429867 RepID=A0A0G4NZC5_PENC3|nr:unnamed protein product [Penicillium camemberti]